MRIKYSVISFVNAIETTFENTRIANEKFYDIELDTGIRMITLTDRGSDRHEKYKGDICQTPMSNMLVGRPRKFNDDER